MTNVNREGRILLTRLLHLLLQSLVAYLDLTKRWVVLTVLREACH